MYVVVQFVEEFESEATKPDAQDMTAGGKVCYVLILITSGHMYLYKLCFTYMYMYACMEIQERIRTGG